MEVIWKETIVVYSSHYHGICLEHLKKITKILSQDNHCFDGDSNRAPLKYKSIRLTLHYALYWVGTEFLNIIQMNFMLRRLNEGIFSVGVQQKYWKLIYFIVSRTEDTWNTYLFKPLGVVWGLACRVQCDVVVIIPIWHSIYHVLRSRCHHVLRAVQQITLYAMYSYVSLNHGLSVTQSVALALAQVRKCDQFISDETRLSYLHIMTQPFRGVRPAT
jgi:hypothetical protein